MPQRRTNRLIQAGLFATGTLLCLLARSRAASDGAAATGPRGLALFSSDVREILLQNCVKCHGGEKTKGEFDLTTREGLLHPGAEGPNVVAGNSGSSRLLKLIRHEDDPTMPAKADKLPAASIEKIA